MITLQGWDSSVGRVAKRPGAILSQVQVPGAARDFSPSKPSVQTFLMVYVLNGL